MRIQQGELTNTRLSTKYISGRVTLCQKAWQNISLAIKELESKVQSNFNQSNFNPKY